MCERICGSCPNYVAIPITPAYVGYCDLDKEGRTATCAPDDCPMGPLRNSSQSIDTKEHIASVLMQLGSWIDAMFVWLDPHYIGEDDHAALKLIWDGIVLQNQIKDMLKLLENKKEGAENE